MSQSSSASPLDPEFGMAAQGASIQTDYLRLLNTVVHSRVRILAAVAGGLFVVGFLISLSLPPLLGKPWSVSLVFAILCAALVAPSVVLFRVASNERTHPRPLLKIGLAYVVLAAAAMAAAEMVLLATEGTTRAGLSGICIWIVLFPLIMPCLPRQALMTAVLCASALPASYAVARLNGVAPISNEQMVDWFLPPYVCAILAAAAAHGVARLTMSLEQARERLGAIGDYRLLELLGSGGMGEVWKAQHRTLPRTAAVKFIRHRKEEETWHRFQSMADHFLDEARAIARLQSPHTIQLFDYGVDQDGALYYAMELVDGMDLRKLVAADGIQSPGRVVHVLSQICLSLAEAHDHGLVHRDIKPDNIMIARFGAQVDVVKVLDFGLVGAVQKGADTVAGSVDTGIAGTPGYIAPEALFGTTDPDPRSDLYAVGVIAYYLLSARTLFPNESGGEDLVAHSIERPRPISEVAPQPVPEDLTAIIMSCLQKTPDRRPPSAADLRQQLLACSCAGSWSEGDALIWWREYGGQVQPRPRKRVRSASKLAAARATTHAIQEPLTPKRFIAPSQGADQREH